MSAFANPFSWVTMVHKFCVCMKHLGGFLKYVLLKLWWSLGKKSYEYCCVNHEACRVRCGSLSSCQLQWALGEPRQCPSQLLMYLRRISHRVYQHIIEISWKFLLIKVLIVMIQSGLKFAHGMTAKLSWHVQFWDVIYSLFCHLRERYFYEILIKSS